MIRNLFPFALACIWLLPACGGSQPEAEVPDDSAQTGAESNDGGDDTAAADESTAAAEEDAASDAEEEEAEAKPAGKNPKDVLLREGTAFMLNHRESDIGKKAEEKCEKQSGDDVAKKANCLSKAINSMDREGVLFDEDGEGWWYVRFAVVKGAKQEYNRVMVEPGEPSGNRITMKTSGKDKAKRRKGTVPSELNFEVPDEYTIILHDDSRGKLVFEPKMGLFGSE